LTQEEGGPTSRRTQAERRARSRSALLESAARAFSRYGYAAVSLDRVAREAGYTRGALYHQFAGKEELTLAVVQWVGETWNAEVGHLLTAEAPHVDPVGRLLALARGHAVYCRRDIARVLLVLRTEFAAQDHPVGRAIEEGLDQLAVRCARLIAAGRDNGSLPDGPPVSDVAAALLGTIEAVGIELAGRAPYDAELAERAVRGLLGLPVPTLTRPCG
jgi:AcrR family transcriptional regulator